MNGSGKAGNGRGNSRRRPFRRWDKENNAWQEKEQFLQGNEASPKENEYPQRNRTFHKAPSGGQRAHSRGLNPENQSRQGRGTPVKKGSQNSAGEKASFFDRPKWVPPIMNTEPLPVPTCPWCNKPIRDISSAMTDKDTGEPVHFDCVTSRIASGENLEQGEMIAYIGGGRFGIVSTGSRDFQVRTPDQAAGQESPAEARTGAALKMHGSPQEGPYWSHDFKIKKVIEWENKDKRAVWRSAICEHYSVT